MKWESTNKLAGLVNLNTVGNVELLDIYFIFIAKKGQFKCNLRPGQQQPQSTVM